MIQKTILHGVEGVRKQPKLNDELISYIKEQEPENKKYTTGVVIYEMMQLTDISDHKDLMDEHEECIDQQLKSEIKGIVDTINKIESKKITHLSTDSNKQVSVWLPPCIDLGYNGSKKIIDAVQQYNVTVYNDRQQRIQVKKDLLDYIQSDCEADIFNYTSLTRDIITDSDSVRNNDVPDYLDQIDMEWYEDTDVAPGYMYNQADDNDLVKETKSARVKFLKVYYNKKIEEAREFTNSDYWDEINTFEEAMEHNLPVDYNSTVKEIMNMFDCSRPSARKYADEVVDIWLDVDKINHL